MLFHDGNMRVKTPKRNRYVRRPGVMAVGSDGLVRGFSSQDEGFTHVKTKFQHQAALEASVRISADKLKWIQTWLRAN